MSDSISSGVYLDRAIDEWDTPCPKNKKHEHDEHEPYGVWVCKHCGKAVYPK